MFSYVSVCQSVSPQGGPHVTITHDALDLTVWGSQSQPCPQTCDSPTPGPSPPWTSDMGCHSTPSPSFLLVISGDHHWKPIQASSLEEDPPPKTGTDIMFSNIDKKL